MTINRVQRPMKITAAKYFTMSLKLYKNVSKKKKIY